MNTRGRETRWKRTRGTTIKDSIWNFGTLGYHTGYETSSFEKAKRAK